MKKILKLENVFTGDIVYCTDMQDTKQIDNITFIKVFKDDNHNRTFLVNKSAFKVVADK